MRSKRKVREAEEAAEQSANEARALRKSIKRKDSTERAKVQRKLIRSIKGKMNPFEFLPDVNTLG